MIPISVDEFVRKMAKDNKDIDTDELRESLMVAVERKKKGETCINCDQSIWAIGSAVIGTDMCFSCTAGEADASEDYEIDTVCFQWRLL